MFLCFVGVFLVAFRQFAPGVSFTTAATIPCIVIAGLFATNFFEPTAQAFVYSQNSNPFISSESDWVCFLAIFFASFAMLRTLLAGFPDPPRLREVLEFRAQIGLAVVASYLMAAITLSALDTSPCCRWLMGVSGNSSTLSCLVSPDEHWLTLAGIIADGSLARPVDATESGEVSSGEKKATTGQFVRKLRLRFTEASLHDLKQGAWRL